MFYIIRGDRKTRDLVGYVKVNWKPPRHRRRSVKPQINPHIICQFTIYLKKESWLGLIFAEGQVPDCPRRLMRIKMNSRPGIIIYAASHCQDIFTVNE